MYYTKPPFIDNHTNFNEQDAPKVASANPDQVTNSGPFRLISLHRD